MINDGGATHLILHAIVLFFEIYEGEPPQQASALIKKVDKLKLRTT